MKKVLGTILFVVYAIIAITVTVLLLSYNDYNNSEIGGYTVYIVTDDSLEPEYKQGSILLIKETNDRNVQVGDEIFIYKVLNSSEYEVIDTTLQAKTQQGNHIIYVVDNEESYANDYFIGKVDDTIVIEGWGYVLNLLESRWGYLFCIVVVSLLLFLQEVFELVMEIKYLNAQKKKAQKREEDYDENDEDDEEYYEDDEYDDDEEDEEEIVVRAKSTRTPRKSSATTTATTRKRTTSTGTRASSSTGTRTRASSSTGTRTKATSSTSTGTKTRASSTTGTRKRTNSSASAKTSATKKTGTTRKTTTATRKTTAKKSAKEEE